MNIDSTMNNDNSSLRKYEIPKVTVMDEAEVLKAFQMTAAQISAAGCWWTTTSLSH